MVQSPPLILFCHCSFQDNRSSQRQSPPFSKTLPSKPNWPSAKTRLTSTLPALTSLQKPQVPPKPKDLEDEVTEICPEGFPVRVEGRMQGEGDRPGPSGV